MNKTECIKKAKAARHAASVAKATAALYATTFGGSDTLTQKALLDADVASEVATKWERVAEWHPKTRAAALRRGEIPSYMFGY